MKAIRSVGSAAALLFSVVLLAAASSNAQRMSAGAAPRAAAGYARPPATHVVAHAAVPRRAGPATGAPYPGVRFNASTNSRVHRFPRGPHDSAPVFYLLDGGVYYPPYPDSAGTEPDATPGADQSSQQQQPELMMAQQPEQYAPANSVEPAVASEPLPDVGQFTLVLQSGQRLQAVAFTRANDKIVYITSDGFRGTIALVDLNTDATRQINADRGTPIQLPL